MHTNNYYWHCPFRTQHIVDCIHTLDNLFKTLLSSPQVLALVPLTIITKVKYNNTEDAVQDLA